MEKEVRGRTIEIEPNSKPYLLKRLIADGFDTALIFMLFMLFTLIIMNTALAGTYNAHYERYTEIETRVMAENGNDAAKSAEVLGSHEEYQYERFAATLHSYLLKLLAAVISEALVLLLLPFILKDRVTPGKLLTGIMPFNERRQSRATRGQVFARFLFVLVFDSMFWYLLTGIFTFLLIPVLRLIEMLISRKNKTICDFVTGVMIIEKISYDGIH